MLLLKKCFCQQAHTKNNFCAKGNIYKMLPLKLNCHFSRVDLGQLIADAVQAAPKNRVHRAYWQAQKSQNLAAAARTRILRWFRNKDPSGKKPQLSIPQTIFRNSKNRDFDMSTLKKVFNFGRNPAPPKI